MKHLLLYLFLIIGISAHAQVAINTDASAPDNSAMLDVKSTNRGMLVPRMTTAQRTAIASPASGLLVFDNTSGSFWFYSAGSWVELTDQGSLQWTPSGSNISYSTGNVGIGDATPSETLTVGNGDKFQVSGSQGDVTFTDDDASIQFPATTNPNSPMIYMFGSGTLNADRMVLSHSPAYPQWGIEYKDTTDVFHFRSQSIRRFSFNMANGRMGIGTTDPLAKLDVNGDVIFNGVSVGMGSGNQISNTVVGRTALNSNTVGNNNSAFGVSALQENSSGNNNTAIGSSSMLSNINGSQNTAVGYLSMNSSQTSSYNTTLGYSAGDYLSNSNYNTLIGALSTVTSLNISNSTGLGYLAMPTASNMVRIGNTAVNSIGGQISWTTWSDGRYKRNVKENIPGLSFISRLRPVSYTADINGLNNHYPKHSIHDGQNQPEFPDFKEQEKIRYSGFIAQEVEIAAREIGYDFSGIDKPQKDENLYGLRYSDFVVPLVKAVQELNLKMIQFENLKMENEDLKAKNAAFEKRLNDLESKLAGK
jgi:hypothetical protein